MDASLCCQAEQKAKGCLAGLHSLSFSGHHARTRRKGFIFGHEEEKQDQLPKPEPIALETLTATQIFLLI